MVKDLLMQILMPVVPKSDLSHWVGVLAHQTWPEPVNHKVIRAFADFYKINLDEAEKPLEDYTSVGDLFARRLKAGARPIGEGIVHPCDAEITQAGDITAQTLIQAKGRTYNCAELIRHSGLALEFEGGSYATYYLCPTDYHRVHSPIDGEIFWSCHVPGEFWPVNAWSVEHVDNLFSHNERVVTVLNTSVGKVAVVMVAATNVGNMEMTFDENICTNRQDGSEEPIHEHSYDPAIKVKRGDELGVFKMGSTVIVLFQAGALKRPAKELKGTKSKMGESVPGTFFGRS